MTKKRRREPLEELTAQAGGKIIDTEQSIPGKSDELHAYYEKALVQLKEIKQVADTQLGFGLNWTQRIDLIQFCLRASK